MREQSAFTLVEVLVVFLIIGILALLAVGQIGRLTQSSELTRTVSNLKNIAGSIYSYASDNNGEFPVNRAGVGVYATPLREYLGETNLVGPATLLRSAFYTKSQKRPYFIGTTNAGYALSYGMNGYIGITNNTVLTAGSRIHQVGQPSKLALLMDFQDHYIISSGTANTNRVADLRARYGGKIAVVFADGHTEVMPVNSIFPITVTAANAATNSFWLGN